MSGHRIAAITRRLLQGFRRDRRTLALLFVAPLIILGLLGYMLRNSSTPAIGVVNEDGGPLGAVVASALNQSTKVTTTTISASDGDANLKDGSIVAYIVFPSDFSQRAQGGVIAPQVHLAGSQPNAAAQALQALQSALATAASNRPGAVRVQPDVTYLYGGPTLDSSATSEPRPIASSS